MALCCIGGICVPYTAIIPFLIIGIQWIIQKCIDYGILPESVYKQLHGWISNNKTSTATATTTTTTSSSSSESCCCSNNETKLNESSISTTSVRRGKQSKDDEQVVTTATATTTTTTTTNSTEMSQSTTNENHNAVIVQIIETKDDWDTLMNNHSDHHNNIIICKFTATWCKPCKTIQPLFESLCTETTTSIKTMNSSKLQFVSIDVDVLDDIASQYNIISLPTFITIQNGRVMDKYSGSNPEQLQMFVHKSISI